ncbi:uncharacterized protein UTRI_00059_B [Ustilago trichophora]|uniref:Zn(2)-C6 fungal-type domain-containing protein n=1 Tax=Ustilago trichophora TaxID=86804 RepID=A0A5C3DNI4_9BASI|nr:uncharacterized protein UTRI_00059_B [Ustilago trichophora]
MLSSSLSFWISGSSVPFAIASRRHPSTDTSKYPLLDRMQHRSTGSTSSLDEGELLRDSQESGVSRAVGMFASSHMAFRHHNRQAGSPYAQGQLFHLTSAPQFGHPTSISTTIGESRGAPPVSTVVDTTASEDAARTQGPAEDPQTLALHHDVRQSHRTSLPVEQGHESSDSADSDAPLELTLRDRKLKRSPSLPFNVDGALEGTVSDAQAKDASGNTVHPNVKLEEHDEVRFDSPLVAKTSGPLKDAKKYKSDVDWVDACKRCDQKGLRCYTAAGSNLETKRCEECVEHHRLCIVDGINVAQNQTQTEIKPKLRKRRTTQKASSVRRKSRRQTVASQQAPVILTASSGSQSQSRNLRAESKLSKRERRDKPSSPPPREQEKDVPDSSSISSAPSSDCEDQAAPSLTEVSASEQSESAASKVRNPRERASDVQGMEASTNAQQNSDSTCVKQPLKPEVNPSQAVKMRLERYTTGLIKDIANAIRRCQSRMEKMPEEAGLLLLENTVTVLLADLSKLLTSDLDGSNPTHWIVPQLAEYLEGIRSECQLAREATDGQQNGAETQARRAAAIFGSDLPFERCLTLISMHVEESSRLTAPH